MSRRRVFRSVASMLAIGACVSCAPGEATSMAADTSPIRFTVGLAAAGPANRTLGEALADEYQRLSAGRTLQLLESAGGAVDTLDALQQGTTDCGVALADVTYLAYAGRLDGRPNRYSALRGLAVLDVAPVHLLVGKDSGIASVGDLAGRVVALGPPGSETRLVAGLVLAASGVSLERIRSEDPRFDVAAAELKAGRIDAMFFTASAPAALVASAMEDGARLLSLQGASMTALLQQYPFLHFARIHADVYPNHRVPVRTIGVEKVLLCRREVDEGTVYGLVHHLFNLLPDIAASAGREWFSALEHAPATPVPLHPGAARFYRERELFP